MEQEPNQAAHSDASPLSDTLSTLLSNPEMMEKIRSIAGQLSPQPAAPATETFHSHSANSLPADGLASVLSDPDLMAKLPQMMAVLKPMLSTNVDSGRSLDQNHPRSTEDCRNDLLLALKPFLSPERCHAIDTMLRIAKLGTVIRQIK